MRSACSAGPAKAGAIAWVRRLMASAVAIPAERRGSRDRAISEVPAGDSLASRSVRTPSGGELPFLTICILIAPTHSQIVDARPHYTAPKSHPGLSVAADVAR